MIICSDAGGKGNRGRETGVGVLGGVRSLGDLEAMGSRAQVEGFVLQFLTLIVPREKGGWSGLS